MPTDHLSYSAYAKRRGVSVEAVSKAVETGRITTVTGKNGRRMIDPATADREWAANTDANMQRGAQAEATTLGPLKVIADPSVPTDEIRFEADDDDSDDAPILAESKRRMEHYKAKLARLKYEEQAGKLVDAEAVRKEAFDVGRTVRESIMGIPDRLAGELASETDAHKVHVLLTNELRQALEALTA